MHQISPTVVLFSWGYWGWGSCSSKFVESVDLVERARGFEPPIFIDARFRRDGRAPEFRGAGFEKVVGAERYRWMIGLGNKGIDTHGLELNDPKAVPWLLALADEYASQHRRVIFYCACPALDKCHRREIAKRLALLAKKQKRSVSVVEWPGTDIPESPIRWNVSQKVIAAVERGRKSFDLPEGVTLTAAAAIAWYTPLFLTTGDEQLPVLIGPAKFQQDRWVVPVLEIFDARGQTSDAMQREALKGRRSGHCEYRGSPPVLVKDANDA